MSGQAAITHLFTQLLAIGTGVGVAVGAFFFMWGAYIYASSSGNPLQMRTGKSAMINAIAGVVLVLAANTIVTMVKTALGL